LQRGPGWTDEQLKERAKLQAQEDALSRNANSRTQMLVHLRMEISHLTTELEKLEAKKVNLTRLLT
jgi:predicted  nucleic acid-binding Zn-ribbon protein